MQQRLGHTCGSHALGRHAATSHSAPGGVHGSQSRKTQKTLALQALAGFSWHACVRVIWEYILAAVTLILIHTHIHLHMQMNMQQLSQMHMHVHIHVHMHAWYSHPSTETHIDTHMCRDNYLDAYLCMSAYAHISRCRCTCLCGYAQLHTQSYAHIGRPDMRGEVVAERRRELLASQFIVWYIAGVSVW